MHWLLLLGAIAGSATAQILLKAGAASAGLIGQMRAWPTLLGLFIYGVAALLYIVALRKIPLSTALPCTALSYLLIALVGHYAFGEALGTQRVVALAIIFSGVVLLASA